MIIQVKLIAYVSVIRGCFKYYDTSKYYYLNKINCNHTRKRNPRSKVIVVAKRTGTVPGFLEGGSYV